MLLARVAEAVYWAGRYLERVEDMSRIVQVHGDTHVDLPVGADVGWAPLLAIAGVEAGFADRARYPGRGVTSTSEVARVTETSVVDFVVMDRDNPSSILSSLAAARDNLRVGRPVVPREVWELSNELWFALSAQPDQMQTREGRVRWLRRAIDQCERINGVLWSTMQRDEALAFMNLGLFLVRVDLTCRMLAARAASAAPTRGRDPYDEVHWMALLRSLAAYQPFRRAMPTRPDDGSTLRFLLQDESFPRAVASCLGELRAILKRLPNNEPVLTACTDAAVLVADVPVDRLTAPELLVLVDDLQAAVLAIHKLLDAVYFHPAAVDGVLEPGPQMTTPRTDRSVAPRLESDSVGDVAGRRTYRVTHRTTFDYDAPVEQAYNEAHLHPRDTDHQLCVYHDIAVEPPPSSRSEYVDAYGNTATIFVVKGGFDRLTVTATSEVVVISPLEPPPSLPWESAQWLLEIDRRPAARVARRFIAPSRLVPALEELAEYAGPSFGAGRPLVDAVVDLAGRIHRDFVYEPGFTTVTTPLCDVFQFRRGVCQDFAHLAIGCLRSLGLAARYVSGYIETIAPSGQERLVGADASHAWFSVHVPGWGWLDVDPTNDQLVSDSYVTTAWGRDYWDVSPLRGSVEGGGASHHMDVAVDVQRMTGSSAD